MSSAGTIAHHCPPASHKAAADRDRRRRRRARRGHAGCRFRPLAGGERLPIVASCGTIGLRRIRIRERVTDSQLEGWSACCLRLASAAVNLPEIVSGSPERLSRRRPSRPPPRCALWRRSGPSPPPSTAPGCLQVTVAGTLLRSDCHRRLWRRRQRLHLFADVRGVVVGLPSGLSQASSQA